MALKLKSDALQKYWECQYVWRYGTGELYLKYMKLSQDLNMLQTFALENQKAEEC